MLRWFATAVVVVLGLATVQGGEPKGKTIVDAWDAVYLEGGRAGYIHTTVEELDRKGQKIYRTTQDMQLIVKRFKQVMRIEAQTGTDETADGKVTGTFMRQVLASGKDLIIVGLAKGKQLEFLRDGQQDMKPIPWDDQVLGLYRQEKLLVEKKVRPGDKFSYLSFEPTANVMVRMDVVVKDRETVELPGKKKAKLLRVELVPEKLQGATLPTLVRWLDDDFKPVRQDTEMPGMGQMSFYRTSREVALAAGPEAMLTDIGIGQFIRLNRNVAKPFESTSAIYRITVKGEENAATAFSQDERQRAVNAKGSTFEMHVRAARGPKKGKEVGNVGDEFTQSSYFITSDDPKVQQLARKAVGKEADPWKKALLIETWVNRNMRATSAEALAPADHVAKTLEGDCTEYAMLMAAMCRAEGVPSKTAIGLIYAETKTGPVMAFHMWTEVWVAGQWIPLDATLGRGYVGATHLKVTDHSWHNVRSMTPLLPLIRVLGKTQVEVVSVN